MKALEAEIELLKHLNHERIVTYFGTAHDSHSICIFMEYLAGVGDIVIIYKYGYHHRISDLSSRNHINRDYQPHH